MGLLSRVHRASRYAVAADPLDPTYYVPSAWWAIPSTSGIRVSPELAMTLSALWCGTTFVAKNIAAFPCLLYRDLPDAGKQRAPQHALAPILRRAPNSWQTAMEFWEMCVGHILLRGNFYAQIVSGRRGFVDQLIPRHPDRVTVYRLPNGRLQYKLSIPNLEPLTLTQDEMFHVRGFSSDGVTGLSAVAYGANSLGSALAAETYAARFFKSGASAAIAAKHPNVLGEEGAKNIRQSISAYLNGLENVGGVLVLEEGMTIDKIGIDPTQAQLLSTREHSVREVARWLGIPAYVLSDGGKPATYASAYQYASDLVAYSFSPLCQRIEQRTWMDLLTPADQDNYFSEFLMDALLRGDLQARAQFYHMAVLDGWMSRNEVRVRENMNPQPGLDAYLSPLNMQSAGTDLAPPVDSPLVPTDPQEARRMRATRQLAAGHDRRTQLRLTQLAFEAAQRIVRKEVAAAVKAAQRCAGDGAAWSAWAREFYGDHAGFVAETLKLPLAVAREYCARQGEALERHGIATTEDWEWTVSGELALLAIDGEGHA